MTTFTGKDGVVIEVETPAEPEETTPLSPDEPEVDKEYKENFVEQSEKIGAGE